jgi:hypothetical protein
MYVCSVQGAAHTLKSGVFERDAEADEAALTGAVAIIIAMLLLLLLIMMMMMLIPTQFARCVVSCFTPLMLTESAPCIKRQPLAIPSLSPALHALAAALQTRHVTAVLHWLFLFGGVTWSASRRARAARMRKRRRL